MICAECKEPCKAVEETISYAGTHCTYGRGGVWHTGVWVSDCCGAETEEDGE